MKTYDYRTDAEQSTIEAETIDEAMSKVQSECGINDKTIADGAWAWVEDRETGERRSVGADRESVEASPYVDADGDCRECGHPANGSSGHGNCTSPAHRGNR